jgi:hypothetical protein
MPQRCIAGAPACLGRPKRKFLTPVTRHSASGAYRWWPHGLLYFRKQAAAMP